eukprot:5523438-Amphidinium_carterae.1
MCAVRVLISLATGRHLSAPFQERSRAKMTRNQIFTICSLAACASSSNTIICVETAYCLWLRALVKHEAHGKQIKP